MAVAVAVGCADAIERLTVADDVEDVADAVDDVNVYGVAWTRICPAMVGFCILGDQTAQGKSPTKRSPTDGLASDCVCDVIFTWNHTKCSKKFFNDKSAGGNCVYGTQFGRVFFFSIYLKTEQQPNQTAKPIRSHKMRRQCLVAHTNSRALLKHHVIFQCFTV